MTSLLPPNATRAERLIEAVFAERLEAIGAKVSDVTDPETCPEHLLPWLAWARSVDVWRPTWSARVKRAVIAASPRVHRLRGTVAAVQAALDAMDARVVLTEWFKTGGAPFTATARIYTTTPNGGAAQLGPELLDDFRAAADLAAPARARLTYQFGVDMRKTVRPRAAEAGSILRAPISAGIVRQRHPRATDVRPRAAATRSLAKAVVASALVRQRTQTRLLGPGSALTHGLLQASLVGRAGAQTQPAARPLVAVVATRPCIRARIGAPQLEAV